MTEQASLFDWTPPKGRHGCRRDPAAGPGTCWHWWEGCPKAEKRGCYFLSEAYRQREAIADRQHVAKRDRRTKGGAK